MPYKQPKAEKKCAVHVYWYQFHVTVNEMPQANQLDVLIFRFDFERLARANVFSSLAFC